MSDIDNVKSRLDIVEVVKKYVPKLDKAGHNYKGICPFHQEKTPSFMVNADMQRYKCFGCGEGGDVITFLQKIEGMEFPDALKLAADMAGYQLSNRSEAQDKVAHLKKQIIAANNLATEFWHHILTKHNVGKSGRDYVHKRQIRDQEIELFKLGYAPRGDNLVKFLNKKGFNNNQLIKYGLAIERKGQVIDKFRDRLMLPIYSMQGDVLGFSGRIITPSEYAPKYLNSPETAAYKKSNILMGLYQAKDATRNNRFLVLEEGNLDLMASHKVGISNIAATGGTALTEDQLRLVKRYADTVYFAFDSDSAGQKAIIKGLEIAEQIGLQHRVIDIGDYQDPDDLIQQEPQLWSQLVADPRNTLDYLLDKMQANLDLGNPDAKSQLMRAYLPVLQMVKDPVQRNHFGEKLAISVGVATEDIIGRLDGKVPTTKQQDSKSAQVPASGHEREGYLLALLIVTPDISSYDIETDIFIDEQYKQIWQVLSDHPSSDRNYHKLADQLPDKAQQALQEILMLDIGAAAQDASVLDTEVTRVYNHLYLGYLRRTILELRAQLAQDPDNATLLSQLQELTHQVKLHQ